MRFFGRRKAEIRHLKSIEEDAAVFAAVVASALDAVIVVDDAGRVVSLNPAAEAMFGYALDEAMGRSIGELIVPEHLKQAHERGMQRYRETQEPHVLGRRVEMEGLCKDGRIIPVELAITEVTLQDRRYFTANLRDLSETRENEAEIERQRDQLHQSEKLAALGSLLAGISHELNNPLSIVLGQSIMMREEAREGAGSAALLSRAEKIEIAAERCARIVRSFLAIARQRKAEKKSFAIVPLLDGAIELFSYGMKSSGIVIARDYDPSLPDVFADPDQVQQIVVNLLSNATQALEGAQGRREILVSARRGRDSNVSVIVADSGPGVPKDIAARIFDPFFTTKPLGAGTGIGLSVSRGLAQSQGGSLSLQNSPLGGAALEILLPVADASAASPEASAAATFAPHTGKGRRALIVDDEAEVGVLIAEALHKAGYASDVTGSGREAQAMISANGNYDAVICDLRMPDVDGPTLFAWIERHHPNLAGRTLFVTGDALGPNAGRFLAACRRPVLEKPFNPADVVRLVGEFAPRNN